MMLSPRLHQKFVPDCNLRRSKNPQTPLDGTHSLACVGVLTYTTTTFTNSSPPQQKILCETLEMGVSSPPPSKKSCVKSWRWGFLPPPPSKKSCVKPWKWGFLPPSLQQKILCETLEMGISSPPQQKILCETLEMGVSSPPSKKSCVKPWKWGFLPPPQQKILCETLEMGMIVILVIRISNRGGSGLCINYHRVGRRYK